MSHKHAFLTSLTRALCPSGVLLFLVPQSRLAVSARYLSSHYSDIRAYRFPEPEYRDFRQVVLFATRKPIAVPDPSVLAELVAFSHSDLPPLPCVPAGPMVGVPALPLGEVLFASLAFDPERAAAEGRRRGAWVDPGLTEQLWPPDERPTRPLMPLRRGHVALLIAAGMLNNCILEQGGQRLLVKGRTYKESVPIDSDDDDLEIQREVLRTSIAVFDLETGHLEIVQQGNRTPTEQAA